MLIFGKRLKNHFDYLPSPINLVLGAGSTKKRGWISTDIVDTSNYYFNFKKDWNFEDKIDLIFGEMILASLNRAELFDFFEGCFKSLKIGGKLRISTINYTKICQLYLEDTYDTQQLLNRHKSKGFLGDFPIDLIFNSVCTQEAPLFGKTLGSYLHDQAVIESILASVGFKNVEYFTAGNSNSHSLINLETRTSDPEVAMQLCFEATKSESN
jgi:predicted SAM-dependent methyltransferase